MTSKLVIGPINHGLRNDRTAFVIDDDSFPLLLNAYQWRGRVKRKRGTQRLGRLQRYIGTTDGSGNITVTIVPSPISIGTSTFLIGTDVFVDKGGSSPVTLITNGTGSATLNRSTGVLTVTGSLINTAVVYIPGLPVLGLEEFDITTSSFPGTIAFDTTYAYNISTSSPYNITDVSFYYNPATGTYPGYTQKGSSAPLHWNGQDYQQFWTTNYQSSMWTTNGIKIDPVDTSSVGMQFKPITGVAITSAGPPATATLTIANHGLSVGDFIFVNEVGGITGINFQTGYVINPTIDNNNVNVEFPNATLGGAYTTGGIAQYLTNTAIPTVDCLRLYIGSPTNNQVPPTFNHTGGWINFSPPISQSTANITDLPAAQYYLVSARLIVPFKDRILFFGPVVQAASGAPIYLQDTVIYSQNGTPYYTGSFTGDPVVATITPILVPTNQIASPAAYFNDVTGFGGFISADLDEPIVSVSSNEDVLIIGFNPNYQARFVYTGIDFLPFAFYIINSELGTSSTFSAISMDKSVIARGPRGFTLTSQVDVQRVDLQIPDEVFQINLTQNGNERMCSQRDFQNEWIYFSYPKRDQLNNVKFPNATLQYNYRDETWALFRENYTTYGIFKKFTGYTWETIDIKWEDFTDPWESGSNTLLQPEVIGGNQQGFVLVRGKNTAEGSSLSVQNFSSNIVTSPNHGLNSGDFISFTGILGTLGSSLNGIPFQVGVTTDNTFTIVPGTTSTDPFVGGGEIIRYYIPIIMTKQFPTAWSDARKTRIGPQRYLLTATTTAQISVQIFLSQDSSNPWNYTTIVPDLNSDNRGLVYSFVVYTCPESTNLGLTPANINQVQLNQLSSSGANENNQSQIWHRMNTSLIGDTIQFGFTMSSEQMFDENLVNQTAEIELHSIIVDISPSQVLA